MITIIRVELNDAQRDYLATLIDNKPTKRLATGKEIRGLVNQFIGATVAQAEYSGGKGGTPEDIANYNPSSDLYQIDAEDMKFLRGKDLSYVRGWNQVKRNSNQ